MNSRVIAGLAALMLLSGCGEPPGQVALGAHEAYGRLARADLTDFILKRQCGILLHAIMEAKPDRSVTWHIQSSGKEIFSFTVALTPIDDRHTKVAVAVSRLPDGREAYDGTQDYPRPALHQPVRPALDELVASLLEGRAFDDARVERPADNNINSACDVQRNGLEAGIAHFSINDITGKDANGTAYLPGKGAGQ